MSPSYLVRRVCLAALATAAFMVMALAQEGNDGTYRLKLTLGAGGAICTGSAGVPSGMSADVSKVGPAMTARLMWCPDNLLSVGLESGWTKIYSYETSGSDAGSVSLNQVPMFIVFAMKPMESLSLLGGYGYTRLNTTLDYAGTVTEGAWSMGWIAAASYEKPVARNLALAGELKWINAIEHETGVITLQVHLIWDFFDW